MPDPSDLLRQRRLFERALALPAKERASFVRTEADTDTALCDEVLELLASHEVAATNALAAGVHGLHAATPTAIPKQLGPYEVVAEIGRGAMGVVYRAKRQDLKNHVAIKLCQSRVGLSANEVLARFDLERRTLAAMNHSCIAKVFDAGTTQHGQPYFVMELIEGVPLVRYCDDHALTIAQRLRLFQQVCDGVQHAHGKFVVHRDLKPDNVLVVAESGSALPKILDFGLAKALDPDQFDSAFDMTGEDRLLGTLLYASPEQAMGKSQEVDVRSDVYSLGVMLYELMTGVLPVSKEQLEQAQQQGGRAAVIAMITESAPQRPSQRSARIGGATVPQDLDLITMKAMAKEPDRRYVAANALAEDIARHLDHMPVLAAPDSALYRVRKLVRRYRGQVIATATVFVTAIVGAITAIDYAMDARQTAKDLEVTNSKLVDQTDAAIQNLQAAQAAQADAEARRDEVLRLAAGRDYEDLMERARLLWPIHPDRQAAYESWILDARKLTGALPAHRETLATLRARGQRSPQGASAESSAKGTSGQWSFPQDDKITPWWHEHLTTLVADLEQLHAGLLADETLTPRHGMSVPWRLATARQLAQDFAPNGAAAKAWQAAGDAVAKRYPKLRMKPQFGLVPIGEDPTSGWMEFAHVTSGTVPTRDQNGKLQLNEDSAIVLVLLPGGTFRMGASPRDLMSEGWEHPSHEVTIRPFFLGKHEITQAQWLRLSGDSPSYFAPGNHDFIKTQMHPVESVAWDRACEVLGRASLELPTEAQWEYAMRAGTTTRWWSGDSVQSIIDANGVSVEDIAYSLKGEKVAVTVADGLNAHGPVHTLTPNPWGFYMMCGNVFEWCQDAALSRFYEQSEQLDPVCRADTEYRMTRGSAHSWGLERTRSAARKAELRTTVVDYVGVRAMRRVDP